MQRNTLFSFLTIAALGATTALGIVMATPVVPASATTFTWDGSQNGEWREPLNWDQERSYPQAGDTAIITSDGTDAEISNNETIALLTISSGTLTITGTNKLKLTGTITHTFNGNLILQDNSAANGPKLAFTDSVTMNGSASIKGEDPDAQLLITSGKTLTNEIILSGKLKVMTDPASPNPGNGTFKNGSTGVVRANANGTLLMQAGLALDDDCGARWEATESDGNGILKFEATTVFIDSDPNLRGDFVLSGCSTINFDGQDVKTSGSFASPSGHIVNVSGKFFYLDAGTCESPTSYIEVTGSQSFGGCS